MCSTSTIKNKLCDFVNKYNDNNHELKISSGTQDICAYFGMYFLRFLINFKKLENNVRS